MNRYQIKPPNRYDTVNSYLVDRWLGQGKLQKTGLRPLTDWFNKRVLKAVYIRQNRYQIDSHLNSDYELLSSTSDNHVSEHDELLDDLRQDGVDGEAVSDDFISQSTLYRHLTNCLGETKERETSNSDWEQDQISHLRERANDTLGDVLTSLDNKDRITGAEDVDTKVTMYLQCPECSREVSFRRAIDQGHVCQDHLPLDQCGGNTVNEASDQAQNSSLTPEQSTLTQVLTNSE